MRALLQGTSLFFWGCQAACTPGQQPAILAGCRCGWRSRLRRRRCGLPSPTVILSRAAAPPAGAAPDSLQHLLRSGKASFCAHVRLHAASVEPNWKLGTLGRVSNTRYSSGRAPAGLRSTRRASPSPWSLAEAVVINSKAWISSALLNGTRRSAQHAPFTGAAEHARVSS